MTLAQLDELILTRYEAESDHSFEDDRSVTVFKQSDNKKWFAATKNIGCRSVGVVRSGRIDIVNLRLSPRDITSLRTREGFRPAWRMNQNAWITILLDGSVPDEEVLRCLDTSFALAGAKGRKR